jgi:hypothetical protein
MPTGALLSNHEPSAPNADVPQSHFNATALPAEAPHVATAVWLLAAALIGVVRVFLRRLCMAAGARIASLSVAVNLDAPCFYENT